MHPEIDPNYSLHGHHLGLGTAVLVAFHLAADPGYIVHDAPELAPIAVEEHHVMIPSHYSVEVIGNDVMRIEIDTSRKLRAIEAHQSQYYSTQRLIASLKSSTSEAIEVCQILQARSRRNFVTALPLNKSIQNIKPQRDWQYTYNSLVSRCYRRQELANLLEQQAEYWGSSQEVLANIQKLRDDKTVAVVTGQQVGILGGAAYTLYKTLGAIKLAQELESQGIPAVPIFWMASYDHDIEEVQRVEIFSNQPNTLNLGLPSTQSPVGSIELGLSIYSLLDEIEESFQNLTYSQEVITALRSAYQPDVTFAQAFARFLSYLTSQLGLIILDPSTREFASLARNIIARELFDGSQTALQETREILSSLGLEETIPTNRDETLEYIPVSAPKTPTPADSKWIVPLAQEIIQHVETNNIDVLNVHYAVGLLEAALEARQELASRGYSLFVCLTLHGSDVNKYGCDSNYNAQLRDCILACDCVTAVSNSLASQAVQIFSLERHPIVIHNAIDLELFHPFRKWIAVPSDTLNLCHVSNFRDVKRPLDAISVLAHVRGAGVPARLIMIGNGPNYIRAREYAEELGVANEVIFLGAVSPTEVVRWLAVTDLQLVTSESESFCLAALEAMACEVPVVRTYCGGLEEIMAILDVDMPAKLLSAPGDTTAMAAKIVQLFNTPSNYQKLRNSLREKIQLYFSRKAQLQAYSNLLMGVKA